MESNEKPINPYRVIGDLMKVLDPKSVVRHRRLRQHARPDQHRVQAQIPRGHLGWGNVSTLGFSLAGAVGGQARLSRAAMREHHRRRGRVLHDGQLRGGGALRDRHHHDPHQQRRLLRLRPGLLGRADTIPYTWKVSDHGSACMAIMARSVGFHARGRERSAEIIPALKRAFDENAKGRPAFLEFICSHYPVHGGGSGGSEERPFALRDGLCCLLRANGKRIRSC